MINSLYCLMVVIVERGKGSKVLKFAKEFGLINPFCLLGKGTINSRKLKIVEMGDVDKEIAMFVIPVDKENEIFKQLNGKFNFSKPYCDIAFSVPLAGIMDMKANDSITWMYNSNTSSKYCALFAIVEKGKGKKVIELSQDNDYYGATIIKARGTASDLKITLNMPVEPEKETVLMVTETDKVCHLAKVLEDELRFQEENTGVMCIFDVKTVIGLNEEEGGEEQ